MRGFPHANRLALCSALFSLGALSLWCWWRIRLLGDARAHLAAFYGWFATAFVLYLFALWFVRQWEGATPPRVTSMLTLSVIGFVAILARLMLLNTTPTLSDDIYRYRWDGRVQQAGIDPYAYPPNASELAFLRDDASARINFPHLRTVYPPLTELAFRFGAAIGPTLTAQKIIFVAAELLTCAALFVILVARGMNPLWLVAYAWHPLVILEIAGSGHNDALGIAMMWAGLAAWQVRRSAAAAVGWALAFLSKYVTVILVPWWWAQRAARVSLAVFLGLVALPLLCHPTAVSALWESLTAMTVRFESNASVYLLIAWLVGDAGAARVIALGVWAVWLLWWARREPDPIRYFFGGMTAAFLLSPVLHPWYLVWLVPCFCFWRPPSVMVLTATGVLVYTVWPGHLTDGRWVIPTWAHLAEYMPVFLLGAWEIWRCASQSSFRLATRPALSAKS